MDTLLELCAENKRSNWVRRLAEEADKAAGGESRRAGKLIAPKQVVEDASAANSKAENLVQEIT